ncbi:transposase [Streptomyces sp. NPDC008001]|uniref:transposase n=1 Tax=Streptomyces sp. NPDC008001 TaxID=3364804 RepID=UPI0036EAAF70
MVRRVDDELWSGVEPLLPDPPAGRRRPGRKSVLEDREGLYGILFVLYMGIPWEWLLQDRAVEAQDRRKVTGGQDVFSLGGGPAPHRLPRSRPRGRKRIVVAGQGKRFPSVGLPLPMQVGAVRARTGLLVARTLSSLARNRSGPIQGTRSGSGEAGGCGQ